MATNTETETLECLDDYGDGECSGPIEFHSIDPGRTKAFPRCQRHWNRRLDARENSIEKYENSDVPPPWFKKYVQMQRVNENKTKTPKKPVKQVRSEAVVETNDAWGDGYNRALVNNEGMQHLNRMNSLYSQMFRR